MSFAAAAAEPTSLSSDVQRFEGLIQRKRGMNVGPSRSAALRDADGQARTLQAKLANSGDVRLTDRFTAAMRNLDLLRQRDVEELQRARNASESGGQSASVRQGNAGGGVSAQAQEEGVDYEFLQGRTREVVEQMKQINEASQRVSEEVSKGHETLVQIDTTIEDAKVETQEGNAEMDKAEQHQKKCQLA